MHNLEVLMQFKMFSPLPIQFPFIIIVLASLEKNLFFMDENFISYLDYVLMPFKEIFEFTA